MPDWTYRTVVRPLARTQGRHDRVLRVFGLLGRMPAGPALIRWFGHARPSPELRRRLFGVDFAAPVGVSLLPSDRDAAATRALSSLSSGFTDVGALQGPSSVRRLDEAQSLRPAVPVFASLAEQDLLDGAPPGIDTLRSRVDAVQAYQLPHPRLPSARQAAGSDPRVILTAARECATRPRSFSLQLLT